MKYNSYRYLYGPRPENPIPDSDLDFWDNGSLTAQPKLNGSNCLIFTNGSEMRVMNRHKQILTGFKLSKEEVNSVLEPKDGLWTVVNGEYLNKNKLDESGQPFNHKLVIFDVLVLNSEYLVGSTFSERIDLMDFIYGTKESEKDYLYSSSENIYRVKSFDKGFKGIYDNLTKIDLIEGLVLKRKNAKLELGITEGNNSKSQLKARKPTKNYRY